MAATLRGRPGRQGRRDSNPQPPVLETGALPIELLPSGGSRSGVRIVAGADPAGSPAQAVSPARRRLAGAGGDEDRPGGAGGGGGRDATDVGHAPARRASSGRHWRSPASSRAARMSASRPGAGSSTSVRRLCSARSSLRYCDQLGLAPQAAVDVAPGGAVETTDARRRRRTAARRRRHTAWRRPPRPCSSPRRGTGSRAACAAPGAAGPWRPTRRCRARRRWPRGAGRRRRGAPRPPAAGAAGPRARRRAGRGWRGVGLGLRIDVGLVSTTARRRRAARRGGAWPGARDGSTRSWR